MINCEHEFLFGLPSKFYFAPKGGLDILRGNILEQKDGQSLIDIQITFSTKTAGIKLCVYFHKASLNSQFALLLYPASVPFSIYILKKIFSNDKELNRIRLGK